MKLVMQACKVVHILMRMTEIKIIYMAIFFIILKVSNYKYIYIRVHLYIHSYRN